MWHAEALDRDTGAGDGIGGPLPSWLPIGHKRSTEGFVLADHGGKAAPEPGTRGLTTLRCGRGHRLQRRLLAMDLVGGDAQEGNQEPMARIDDRFGFGAERGAPASLPAGPPPSWRLAAGRGPGRLDASGPAGKDADAPKQGGPRTGPCFGPLVSDTCMGSPRPAPGLPQACRRPCRSQSLPARRKLDHFLVPSHEKWLIAPVWHPVHRGPMACPAVPWLAHGTVLRTGNATNPGRVRPSAENRSSCQLNLRPVPPPARRRKSALPDTGFPHRCLR